MSKKKTNYFRLTSPRIKKVFKGLISTIFAISFVLIAIIIVTLIDLHFAKQGMSITTLFPGLLPFARITLGVILVLFMAFSSVVIYNYISNRENKQAANIESPLLGAAKDHEEQIIEILKSIAKPEPGTNKLNRANTIHFLRTLKELGVFDPNIDGQHQKAWVEQATGYEEKSISAFNQALDKQKANPKLVAEYRKQIEQILAE